MKMVQIFLEIFCERKNKYLVHKKVYFLGDLFYIYEVKKKRGKIMIADYAKCAKQIFETIEEKSKLVSADHCATRLRLVAEDNQQVDMEKLEHIDGVKGVFSNNGQIHLIIGTEEVEAVFDELVKASGITGALSEKEEPSKEQSPLRRVLKALGDAF